MPVAFSVWDGFNRERGNRRALSAWQHVYVRPASRPSPLGPIAKASLAVLALELLLIGWVRRRSRGKRAQDGVQPDAVAARKVTTN